MSRSGSQYFFQSGGGSASASGATGKNYLSNYNGNPGNGDFELGTTSGWVQGNTSLTSSLPSGTPTFGSGFSGLNIFAVTGTNPLGGKYSLNWTLGSGTP